MLDLKVLGYNTIMSTMVGLQNANGLIMYNKRYEKLVTVPYMRIFKIAEQKNESETCKNKLAKFFSIPSTVGPKPSIFTYGPIL